MHTLKLLLKTTKEEEIFIAAVFSAIAKVHNAFVAEGKKRLRMVQRDKRYRYAKKHYGEAASEATKLDKSILKITKQINECTDHARKKVLREQLKTLKTDWRQAEKFRKRMASELDECLQNYGLSKTAMDAYATTFNKRYKGLLNSQQIQVEAERVWAGMEKVLFGDGK